MKRRREQDMYPAVKRYFQRELACTHVSVDLPAEKKVHLPRNLSKRDPDLLGITEDDEVVVAEGKILRRSGQPFEQCVQQIESLKSFADFLYAFFPKEDWDVLSKDDADQNRKVLRDKNIGLILVDERRDATVLARPPRNEAADDSKRELVRGLMGLANGDAALSLPGIDPANLERLSAIFVCCENTLQEIIRKAIAHVFKKTRAKGQYDIYPMGDANGRQGAGVLRWGVWPKDVMIEIDILGGFLADGRPCIWVSRDVSEQFLGTYIEDGQARFGTHVMFYDRDDFVACADVTEERIRACTEAGEGFCICHRVDLCHRTKTGLEREVAYIPRLAGGLCRTFSGRQFGAQNCSSVMSMSASTVRCVSLS